MYAVFAVTYNPSQRRGRTLAQATEQQPTFRIGKPTTLDNAMKRHARLDRAHYTNRRELGVFVAGRRRPYLVRHLEVRQVDEHGRGLGRPDHFNAVPVLAGAIRVLPDAPHTVDLYRNRAWRATDAWGCTLKSDAGVIIGYGKNPIEAAANARASARRAQVI